MGLRSHAMLGAGLSCARCGSVTCVCLGGRPHSVLPAYWFIDSLGRHAWRRLAAGRGSAVTSAHVQELKTPSDHVPCRALRGFAEEVSLTSARPWVWQAGLVSLASLLCTCRLSQKCHSVPLVTRVDPLPQAEWCPCTHARMRARARAHTHTHTHSHTLFLSHPDVFLYRFQ